MTRSSQAEEVVESLTRVEVGDLVRVMFSKLNPAGDLTGVVISVTEANDGRPYARIDTECGIFERYEEHVELLSR